MDTFQNLATSSQGTISSGPQKSITVADNSKGSESILPEHTRGPLTRASAPPPIRFAPSALKTQLKAGQSIGMSPMAALRAQGEADLANHTD